MYIVYQVAMILFQVIVSGRLYQILVLQIHLQGVIFLVVLNIGMEHIV